MSLKRINDYAELFDVMKAHKFFPNPFEQVETFIRDIKPGWNLYDNEEVEIWIHREPNGVDNLVNRSGIKSDVLVKLFAVA